MEMLRAVLDTNLWLSTHVVVVTLGYASMFVAGLLAIIYIVRGFFTRSLTPELGKTLARMVYGIVCFATLFSFVGTILGGIWADQSWGRFWGWDPKENGALLIVLWNAMILHARWGGMIKERGLMAMAVFGNIVTSFSWFGVNMLGIGLHSYGFMDAAFRWLMFFDATQVALIILALTPARYWASFKAAAAPAAASPAAPARRLDLKRIVDKYEPASHAIGICALLFWPLLLPAAEPARLPYELIYRIQKTEASLSRTFTNLEMFLRMSSTLPEVDIRDLVVYIDSKDGRIPVALNPANGSFSLPMRDSLVAEGAWVVANQPKGTDEFPVVCRIEGRRSADQRHALSRPDAAPQGARSHPGRNGEDSRRACLDDLRAETDLPAGEGGRRGHPRQERRPGIQDRREPCAGDPLRSGFAGGGPGGQHSHTARKSGCGRSGPAALELLAEAGYRKSYGYIIYTRVKPRGAV